jgi:signal transduction histidine kinase
MVFRGVQTLLNLCRDQLGGKNIRVVIDVGIDAIKATIEDDGKGFDPEVALNQVTGDTRFQALTNLRERIEIVGGKLDIYSNEGEGSRFQIILPIIEDEEPELN